MPKAHTVYDQNQLSSCFGAVLWPFGVNFLHFWKYTKKKKNQKQKQNRTSGKEVVFKFSCVASAEGHLSWTSVRDGVLELACVLCTCHTRGLASLPLLLATLQRVQGDGQGCHWRKINWLQKTGQCIH